MSHQRLEEGGGEFRKRMMDFNLAVKKTAFQLTRKNICPMLVTFGQTLLYTITLMPHARRAPSNHENPPSPPFSKGGLGDLGVIF
jgi:hypothetical protein